MKPDTVTENDGVLYELSVIDPTEGMQKELETHSKAEIAQELLKGKGSQWTQFHTSEPKEVSLANLKALQIDFDAKRNSGDPRILGFQIFAQCKDKVVTIVAQVPEASRAELQTLSELLKTVQIQ